ncbi:MAG: HEAT repeat domain-containing protein [Candidatus Coproplasma sp.]
MKIYDFDGMFDEKLSEYIQKHSGEYKEKEWEDIIPKMYARFGDTTIKSLGKSPNQYYSEMDDNQLVAQLRSHLKNGVPISVFLCNAIEARKLDELLLPLLSGTEDEIAYALNLIGVSKIALPEYMRLLTTSDDEDVLNTCVDNVKELADDVKEEALAYYEKGVQKEYMMEILSRCVIKDERIFDILLKEFRTSDENVSMHASYLASYGDERALPYLLDKIDEEGISFIEYQELKYAIESLGGSYEKERDFSSDPYYQIIKSHNAKDVDIFSAFNPDKKDD